MTQEEKAKAYDDALERAKTLYENANGMILKKWVEQVFPELAESEDEKIRKRIITLVNAHGQGMYKDEMLDWLEKQGEQKPVKVPKFKVGDFIQFNGIGHNRYTIKEVCGLSHYINSCDRRMDMAYTDANFELVEQPPAWSKEDESILQGIWDEILANKHNAKEYEWKTYDEFLNWLESLKDRVQPQPK